MSDSKPESLHPAFASAFAARDIEALLGLYEDDAKFIGPDGSEAVGKDAIRGALQGFFDVAGEDGTLKLDTLYAYQSGDLAMLSNEWVLNATDPDGNPIEMNGKTVEVARQQSDGSWLMVLDNPMGAS